MEALTDDCFLMIFLN
uniref:Uncharacterized protein n=1 Tax=Anguilla anguilla TaxID=7936 RepID=A0A0E9Q161_ANGAN